MAQATAMREAVGGGILRRAASRGRQEAMREMPGHEYEEEEDDERLEVDVAGAVEELSDDFGAAGENAEEGDAEGAVGQVEDGRSCVSRLDEDDDEGCGESECHSVDNHWGVGHHGRVGVLSGVAEESEIDDFPQDDESLAGGCGGSVEHLHGAETGQRRDAAHAKQLVERDADERERMENAALFLFEKPPGREGSEDEAERVRPDEGVVEDPVEAPRGRVSLGAGTG